MTGRKKWSDLRAKLPATSIAKLDAERERRHAEIRANMPLHELRQARQMSQQALADVLDTSQSSICICH